jgi:hypothetical protein
MEHTHAKTAFGLAQARPSLDRVSSNCGRKKECHRHMDDSLSLHCGHRHPTAHCAPGASMCAHHSTGRPPPFCGRENTMCRRKKRSEPHVGHDDARSGNCNDRAPFDGRHLAAVTHCKCNITCGGHTQARTGVSEQVSKRKHWAIPEHPKPKCSLGEHVSRAQVGNAAPFGPSQLVANMMTPVFVRLTARSLWNMGCDCGCNCSRGRRWCGVGDLETE